MIRLFLCAFTLLFVGPLLAQEEYVVDDIEFFGNRRTKEEVMLRELPFKLQDNIPSGQLDSLVSLGEKRLRDLSLFNYVEIIAEPSAGSLVFRINVVERWYLWPSFAIEIADPNFNVWWETKDFGRLNYALILRKFNLRGQNESLYLKAKLGYTKEFKVNYEDPQLFSLDRMALHTSFSYKENEEVTTSTIANKRELFSVAGENARIVRRAELDLKFRPKRNESWAWVNSYQFTSISDSLGRFSDTYLGNNRRVQYEVSTGVAYDLNRSDVFYYPLKGDHLQVSSRMHFYSKESNIDASVLRTNLSYARYGHLKGAFFWSSALNLKSDLGEAYPYSVYRGFGYDHYARGYEYYIFDVRHYALLQGALKFELMEKKQFFVDAPSYFSTPHLAIYLNAYVDLAYTSDDVDVLVNTLSEKPLISGGLGIDFVSFYDKVLRLETSMNAESELGFFVHFSKAL